MKIRLLIHAALLAGLINGCAGSSAIQHIRAGRLALATGNPALALKQFEPAAAVDARIAGAPLCESAWPYIGRSYYETKEYGPARQALDRALALNHDDAIAQLYLGLVGARTETNDAGRKQIQAGLQALGERLDYIKRFTPAGEFWDPTGRLGNEIDGAIKSVSAAPGDWQRTLAQIERLARDLENEIDAAQRDESHQRRGGGDGSGDM